jgi:LysM repeat protein
VVQPGDTLWELAQAAGCSVEQLREANRLDPEDPLVLGRELELPICTSRGDASKREVVVAKGDTLASIAQRHGTSIEELRRLNGIEGSLIRIGQRLVLPGTTQRQVRVFAGQSIGRVDRGTLHNSTRLPKSSHYFRRRVERTYATTHLIDHTLNAISSVYEQFPKLHRLAIGDLSAETGGWLSGHASHQSGRDIDIGLFYRKQPAGYPEEFVVATRDSLDAAATWALVEALVETAGKPGGVEKIFLDYELQGWLYEHARKQGWSKARLADVFQYPDGEFAKHGLVRHEPNHADHLHVRFGCPAGDNGCR